MDLVVLTTLLLAVGTAAGRGDGVLHTDYTQNPPVTRRCIEVQCECGTEPRFCVAEDRYATCEPCHTGTFQPLTVSSVDITNRRCLLHSDCMREGQVIATPGTPCSDTKCTCRHREGYKVDHDLCVKVAECQEGEEMLPQGCAVCRSNYFKNFTGYDSCLPCSTCNGSHIMKNCTNVNDTVCTDGLPAPAGPKQRVWFVRTTMSIIGAVIVMVILIVLLTWWRMKCGPRLDRKQRLWPTRPTEGGRRLIYTPRSDQNGRRDINGPTPQVIVVSAPEDSGPPAVERVPLSATEDSTHGNGVAPGVLPPADTVTMLAEKLDNVRGDLVTSVRCNEALLSYMMQNRCLSSQQKANIQQMLVWNDEPTAVGRLLDIVRSQLVNGDSSAYNQLVYSLVITDQLMCAKLLDQQLTEKFRQESTDDSKHGPLTATAPDAEMDSSGATGTG